MQPTMRIIVSMALLASAIASAYRISSGKTKHNHHQLKNSNIDSSAKLRRDGVLNLYPFPRVGRASRNTWQLPLNDMYFEYQPSIEKRQLYAFPRVGRSDLTMSRLDSHEFQPMAVRRTESPGMWFGPRLGRGFKSDDDEITIQNESNDHSEPEQTEPLHEDRRKRQTFN